MMAVSYLNDVANVLNMPLVICLALGNSMGGHGTDGPLSNFLNYISTRRRRSIVTATGNEANTRHHFRGRSAVRWNMRMWRSAWSRIWQAFS